MDRQASRMAAAGIVAPSHPRNLLPPPYPGGSGTAADPRVPPTEPPVCSGPRNLSALSVTSGHSAPPAGPRRHLAHDKESAGWLTSLVVHVAAIVMIGLLLSPADFSGEQSMKLIVTLTEEHEEIDLEETEAELQVGLFESEVVAEELDDLPQVEVPPPLQLSMNDLFARADGKGGQAGALPQRGGGGGAGEKSGPRGSFFGIEASGHTFVYVVDMSGSMEGGRFARATHELCQSVAGLSEKQLFYVLLFDDHALQLFGETSGTPSPIPATSENQQRLSQWLSVAFRGGGTDPRDALHLGLQMKPSAIFLLSDGQFNSQPRRSRFIRGNSDVFSLAAASPGTPIHTIAFENTSSCVNMQRLAEMSGGTYRFVAKMDEALAAQALAGAQATLDQGDEVAAEQSLRQMIADFGPTQPALEARNLLASLLFHQALEATSQGRYDVAQTVFLEIVSLDPNALATDTIQQEMIAGLWQRAIGEPDTADAAAANLVLDEILAAFYQSRPAVQIVENWASFRLANAQRLQADPDDPQAQRELEKCRRQHQQRTQTLMGATKKVWWEQDLATYARHLRDIAGTFSGTSGGTAAQHDLDDLANRLFIAARDAFQRRDRDTGKQIHQLLQQVLGAKIFEASRRKFYQRERIAEKKFEAAGRLEARGDMTRAIQAYEETVANFSGTVAADQARQRLP